MRPLDKSALAHQMHAVIRDRISQVRQTKIEVYLLLARFKRARLYRHLSVPICPRHVGRICAERRFSTWEDYLASLGECGISFGYFAELERLARRPARLTRAAGWAMLAARPGPRLGRASAKEPTERKEMFRGNV